MSYSPTQIGSTANASALGSGGYVGHCPLLVTQDSYRIVPSVDSSGNLSLSIGTSGGSWTTTSYGTGIISSIGLSCDFGYVPANSGNTGTIIVCVATGSSTSYWYAIAYNGGGSLGTTAAQHTVKWSGSGQSDPTYLSVKCVWSAAFSMLYSVWDGGTQWGFGLWGPSMAGGGGSLQIAPAITNPTHAVKLIAVPSSSGSDAGYLYCCAPGSSAWGAATFPLLAANPGSGIYQSGYLDTTIGLSSVAAPTLPVSAFGAALCLSDTTSNPGVDILVNDANGSGHIKYQNRGNPGTYGNVLDIGGTPSPNAGIIASQNSASGNEIVICADKTSGHLGSMIKTNGAWGLYTQQDFAPNTVSPNFAGLQPDAYGAIGPAVVYVVSGAASPYPLDYDDAGSAAGAIAPTAPTNLTVTDIGAVSSGTSWTTQSTTPTVQAIYHTAAQTDPLGGYRIVYTLNGTTTWDSGRVSVTNGPASGGTFSMPYTGTALSAGNTYSVACYSYDSLGNLVSPASSAITVYVAGGFPLVTIDTTSLTQLNPPITFDYFQPQGTSCGTYDIFFVDSYTGDTLYDTGTITPSAPIKCSTLAVATTAGTNNANFTTYGPLDVGSTVVIGTRANQLVTTITSGGQNGSNYTYYCASTLAWAVGTQVATRFTTPGIACQSKLTNGSTVGLNLRATVSPPAGVTAWSIVAERDITVNFPAPPVPTNLIAEPIPGIDPLDPAYIGVRWQQPSGTPTPVTSYLYLRESGTATWTLHGTLAATIGTNTAKLFSVEPNVAYDVGIASADVNGIESAIVTNAAYSGVALRLRMGLSLCDPADPSTSVELGLVQSQGGGSGTLPQWDPTLQQDFGQMFNRSGYVVTTGNFFAMGHSTDQTYVYESGWMRSCQNQLLAWLQAGTTLLFRDSINQLMFYCVLRKVSPTAVVHANVPGVVLNITSCDPGPYTYVVTS